MENRVQQLQVETLAVVQVLETILLSETLFRCHSRGIRCNKEEMETLVKKLLLPPSDESGLPALTSLDVNRGF